jgi:hypothetical protein
MAVTSFHQTIEVNPPFAAAAMILLSNAIINQIESAPVTHIAAAGAQFYYGSPGDIPTRMSLTG